MNTLSLVQVPNCTLTETAAQFDQALDFKDWMEAGKKLCKVNACALWWIGDWLNFGVNEYGDKSKLAGEYAEELGLSPDTLRRVMIVSKAVEVGRRLPSLSWSHHLEVAPLSVRDQKRWLAKALEEKWSVSQLRCAIREAQAEFSEPSIPRPSFIPINWVNEGLRHLRSLPVEKWDTDQRKTLKNELKPIVELYESL